MAQLRLRTQLLIAALLIISSLTGVLLFIVRRTVRSAIDRSVQEGTASSIRDFENVQQQREIELSRTAAILAELPTLKALMTTNHAPTIQDGSEPFWKLSGSDLFLLANRGGEVVAAHITRSNWHDELQEDLKRSLDSGEDAAWWYAGGQLYWVFLRTVTAGAGVTGKQLGILAVGYRVDATVADQLSIAAGSQIALATGHHIIASTLSASREQELQKRLPESLISSDGEPRELSLGPETYEVASVLIHDGPPVPVRCYVLMSLQPVNSFIQRLTKVIFVLGIAFVLLGAILLSFVSRTITRPLENMVAAFRALATGDYAFTVTPRGSSEVAELSVAFAKMRSDLLSSQQRWMAAERTAALGRAASSISHDLRHYLAALVANAEFLYESEKLDLNKDDIYEEIKAASEQMTELLDSLRQLAREGVAISPVPASMALVVQRAVDGVLRKPELRDRLISIHTSGEMEGVFDPKKMERVLFNLILNACEAATQSGAKITVDVASLSDRFEIRVMDNGPGIPAGICATVFDPFVSWGKANGTGLGLAIASRIVADHAGSVVIESTSPAGTVFFAKIPRFSQPVAPDFAVDRDLTKA